ncbi:hypothetical protein IT413_05200 [Candidatus Peregrinibacteria bacterium]|nr:hypothetical protein [Candidatus Peregrinibacteria bacterium]
MKKILITIIAAFTLFNGVYLIPAAFAQESIVPTVTYPNEANKAGSKVSLVKQLPSEYWQVLLANVIKFILQITGSLTFISFIVGGVIMVVARGNEEEVKKGKGIILWSVVALLIIAISYAIVTGVTQLVFFQ